MAVKIKLKLNRVEWDCLATLLRETTRLCPIEGWSLESYIVADLYVKKMAFWSIFPYERDNRVKVTLSMIQAIAINELFGAGSSRYNMLLRMKIEPHLILDTHKYETNDKGTLFTGDSSDEPVDQNG